MIDRVIAQYGEVPSGGLSDHGRVERIVSMRLADVVAGVSVAGLMLPEAVAYAGIAGLPAQSAIAAAIMGCLVYALAGRSRFAIVTPTSSSAAILAATMMSMGGNPADKLMLAMMTTAIVGAIFMVAALMRLGGLAGFVSRPVLQGFAFGLAVTIIIRQLPVITGFHVPAGNIFHVASNLMLGFGQWHWASIALGAVALIALLGLRRFMFLPGSFLVLAVAIATSHLLDLSNAGIAMVGAIDMHPTLPSFSAMELANLPRALSFSLPLVLILLAESWATMRAFSLRHGDVLDANREFAALGLANVASALAQGMPVGAGFSAGAASEAAGARTRATATIAAIGLAVLIAGAGDLLADLPAPVLAAVVVAALAHALDPRPLLRLQKMNRDFPVALASAAGVLALGVMNGMLIAIGLSLAALLQRLASPYVARLGRLGKSHDFVDIARHGDAVEVPDVVIWRPSQPLFFANVDAMLNVIRTAMRAEPRCRAVVISLEESFDLDSTAYDALVEFDRALRASGLWIQYARVHDRVRDLMTSDPAAGFADRCSYSVDGAIATLSQPQTISGDGHGQQN